MGMDDRITIRELRSMDELNATVDLQKAVWGMQDVEVSSPHTLKAVLSSGGAVIGAVSAGRLVGFCFGFGALRDGEVWLWSHMTGVHPAVQGRGIGYRLKRAQRDWALRQGYRVMAWTFDPMQAGNANFNFNRLGVTARSYSVNHYGDMRDGLNAGLASDRLVAHWQLDEPLPPPPGSLPHAEGAGELKRRQPRMTVYMDKEGAILRTQPKPSGEAAYGIEIPADIAQLKRDEVERARQWQLLAREAMMEMLAAGYIVSGFTRAGDKCWYVLSRAHPPVPDRPQHGGQPNR